MKAFLQYLVYLVTGKTLQQQRSEAVLTSPALSDFPDSHHEKRQAALDYLGDKWLLHPANHVRRCAPREPKFHIDTPRLRFPFLTYPRLG